MILPPYKGAVFRGAFGNAFRRLVCLAPKADCRSCDLRQRCLYVAIFEPPASPGYRDAAKFSQAPRPYVINPPLTSRQSFRPGEPLEFDLALMGPAIEALPYFIYIFMEMGRQGLGRERGKYELLQVDVLHNGASFPVYQASTRTLAAFVPESGPLAIPGYNRITSVIMQFLTPLRLKEKGDLVTRLTFPLFFNSLAQRLKLMLDFYGGNGAHAPNSKAEITPVFPNLGLLAVQAAEIKVVKNDLHWFDWERYSRRQNTTMKFGGLMGRIIFSGELRPFLPYLRLGQAVNVGQATTFGLGRYELA
jgi:CRISPR/Cas system endoribonuclease Cas6 (RAMP superfamily)